MDFNDKLRLEIEVPTEGLPNLVQNPSGELGSWGWVTPVANTNLDATLDGNTNLLTIGNGTVQAVHFTTEDMPVAAGKYVAGRFDILYGAAGVNLKARFEFYDTNKTLLSSSTQTPAMSAAGTHYFPAVQAPTNTAYVRLRFDMYNGTGNPGVGNWISFNKAMVTHADTNEGLGSTLTNLYKNPGFEGTLDWVASTYANAPTKGGGAKSGSYAMNLNPKVGGEAIWRTPTNAISVEGGKSYRYQVSLRAANTAHTGREWLRSVEYYDNNGTKVGSHQSGWMPISGDWYTHAGGGTAPSSAVTACVRIHIRNHPGNNEIFYVDELLVTEGLTAYPYFDGDTTDTTDYTYAWTGTRHASTSVRTSGAAQYDFSEPHDWRNILGPTHEIQISRKELDVGLLSATVLDALLDPAVADVIRPGKRIRLTALVEDKWEEVYTGKVSNAHVTYPRDKKAGSKVETRIELTASDAIAELANQGEGQGVANIDDLPYILEGKGVPWNVNGSGNQKASATVVSWNENASVLDQVAITRDSNQGYAFVAKNGVLTVSDATPVMTGIKKDFTDGIWDNIAWANPSFESTDMSMWEVIYPMDGATLSRDTTQVYAGSASMKVTVDDDGWLNARTPAAALVPVKPNHLYGYSLKTKAGTTGRAIKVGLAFYTANDLETNITNEWHSGTNNTSGWTEIDVWTKAPTNAAYMRMFLELENQGTGVYQEAHYFDDIQAIEVPVASYTDIDVDFNMERCINQVTVNWLRYDIGADSTTEIPYGPYQDAASVAKWGPRAASFSIHGATESESAIATFAADVLSKNGTPRVMANSLTMPVRNDYELSVAADLELYERVDIDYADKVDDFYLVTGIEHRITPEKWLVTLTFGASESVAAPTWTPSPPFKGLSDAGGANSGVVQMYAGTSVPTGWLLCNGQQLNKNEFSGLFTAIGYNYGGSGDYFNVPNLVQKFPLGGNGGDAGASGGSKKITTSNMPSHNHYASLGTSTDGSHTHVGQLSSGAGTHQNRAKAGAAGDVWDSGLAFLSSDGNHSHTASGYTDNSGSGTDFMPPYVTMNFIIKA